MQWWQREEGVEWQTKVQGRVDVLASRSRTTAAIAQGGVDTSRRDVGPHPTDPAPTHPSVTTVRAACIIIARYIRYP